MSNNLKNCAYCRFDIPANAKVCGHCGAKFSVNTMENDALSRILITIWHTIRGAFSFGLMAVIAAYVFGEPGTVVKWGTWWTIAGGALGFIGGLAESKSSSTEYAERD